MKIGLSNQTPTENREHSSSSENVAAIQLTEFGTDCSSSETVIACENVPDTSETLYIILQIQSVCSQVYEHCCLYHSCLSIHTVSASMSKA